MASNGGNRRRPFVDMEFGNIPDVADYLDDDENMFFPVDHPPKRRAWGEASTDGPTFPPLKRDKDLVDDGVPLSRSLTGDTLYKLKISHVSLDAESPLPRRSKILAGRSPGNMVLLSLLQLSMDRPNDSSSQPPAGETLGLHVQLPDRPGPPKRPDAGPVPLCHGEDSVDRPCCCITPRSDGSVFLPQVCFRFNGDRSWRFTWMDRFQKWEHGSKIIVKGEADGQEETDGLEGQPQRRSLRGLLLRAHRMGGFVGVSGSGAGRNTPRCPIQVASASPSRAPTSRRGCATSFRRRSRPVEWCTTDGPSSLSSKRSSR